MSVDVRIAELADAAAIAPLFDAYRQFYQQPPDTALALAFISERLALRESVILLALQDTDRTDIAGFAQLYPLFSSIAARRSWLLNDLYVLPTLRGQGVGRTLLGAAKAHARATGATRLALSTAYDNPAQKLYEAVGYQRDSNFLHYTLQLD